MSSLIHERAADTVAAAARPLERGWDELIDVAGDAEVVLIGEASHGTHEFYAIRAELTRRLIAERGFGIVALEADWPDALRIHRYVAGRGDDPDARAALADFRRFPSWMWRNTVMVDFVEWLHGWNRDHPEATTGIFGMDLYSLHSSIDAVLAYLDRVDPQAAARARARYGCFDHFAHDPQRYGFATMRGDAESCEDDVVAQLIELRRRYGARFDGGDGLDDDELFYAQQNASLVANAERYYREMFRGRANSWNLRDQHMTETLEALSAHHRAPRNKIVVWAHNSHLGDARATEMSERGEINVGQLTRERFGRVYGIGFSTYDGTVTAARDWGEPAERRRVLPGLPGSYEALLHSTGRSRFWLDLHERGPALDSLRRPRLQRAIGVIYRPETERWSHYFETTLPQQFDALVHVDRTSALEPLERDSAWQREELPETYPEGL
ncbi:MAG TPA: erythromycin esterase family protein [Burkholderiaceae bacterium]|nr:erythromycin esterase family protein [Burkholderiaceae bacterium]